MVTSFIVLIFAGIVVYMFLRNKQGATGVANIATDATYFVQTLLGW